MVSVVRTYGMGLKHEPYDAHPFNMTADLAPHIRAAKAGSLPSSFDTRIPDLFPVRDQGQQSTCVAFSCATVANLLEHWDSAKNNAWLSPREIYWWRPNRTDPVPANRDGMNYSDLPKLLNTYGTVPEAAFPYEGDPNVGPTQDIVNMGKKYPMTQFATINTVNDLKAVLFSHRAGASVAFNVWNFGKYFFKQNSGDGNEGGHGVSAVAYDDNAIAYSDTPNPASSPGRIVIQNQWGTNWGDKGFTYMSYDDFNRHLQQTCLTFVAVDGGPPLSGNVVVPPQPNPPNNPPNNPNQGKGRCGKCALL